MAKVIGARIKALRRQRGLSQDALARVFGFKDRQTVSAIETGVRGLTAAELVVAVEKLDVGLDYFTDPFRLDGEGRFSWRQSGVASSALRWHLVALQPPAKAKAKAIREAALRNNGVEL